MVKIYKMNDCDWVAAENIEDAKRVMAETLGFKTTQEAEVEGMIEEPRELTGEELDKLMFCFDDSTETKISFRERLSDLQVCGEAFPTFFASTEY